MDARRSSLLQEANTLLLNAGFRHHTIANNEELQLNASSMLVALFEALLDVYMPQVKRKPETDEDYAFNADLVLNAIDVMTKGSLRAPSQVNGQAIVAGDLDAIRWTLSAIHHLSNQMRQRNSGSQQQSGSPRHPQSSLRPPSPSTHAPLDSKGKLRVDRLEDKMLSDALKRISTREQLEKRHHDARQRLLQQRRMVNAKHRAQVAKHERRTVIIRLRRFLEQLRRESASMAMRRSSRAAALCNTLCREIAEAEKRDEVETFETEREEWLKERKLVAEEIEAMLRSADIVRREMESEFKHREKDRKAMAKAQEQVLKTTLQETKMDSLENLKELIAHGHHLEDKYEALVLEPMDLHSRKGLYSDPEKVARKVVRASHEFHQPMPKHPDSAGFHPLLQPARHIKKAMQRRRSNDRRPATARRGSAARFLGAQPSQPRRRHSHTRTQAKRPWLD